MNLTIPQMTLLKTCVHDQMKRMEKTADLCIGEEPAAQWKAEAEAARQLLALLDDALFISVESVNLTPQGEPCGDINCDEQCQAAEAVLPILRKHKPALLQLIDNCSSVEAASDEIRLSARGALMEVARHLNVPLTKVAEELIRRTRARLLKPL